MTRQPSAFTLVELLVSMAILTLMLTVLLQMTNQTSRTWHNGAAKAEQFSEARKAFETMTQRISTATLNTYLDYAFDPNAFDPSHTKKVSGKMVSQSSLVTDYVRQSDLRFRVLQMPQDVDLGPATLRPTHGIFFQGPFGAVDDTTKLGILSDLLNSWGYFVEVGNTNDRLPNFLQASYPARYRSRLMEFGQSAEQFSIYKTLADQIRTNGLGKYKVDRIYPSRDPVAGPDGKVTNKDDKWFTDPIDGLAPASPSNRPVRVLAENVIALIVLPRLSPEDEQQRLTSGVPASLQALSPDYRYHSKQVSNYIPVPNAAVMAQQATWYGPINPKNQIPPVVQVAMVAIDETSAANLERTAKDQPTLDLKTLLQLDQGTPLFTNSLNLETSTAMPNGGDLKVLEQALIDRNISYRIFSSNIAMKSSKWSSVTTK